MAEIQTIPENKISKEIINYLMTEQKLIDS